MGQHLRSATPKSVDFVRLAFALWAAGSLFGVHLVLKGYPPDQWVTPVSFGLIGAALVAAPLSPSKRLIVVGLAGLAGRIMAFHAFDLSTMAGDARSYTDISDAILRGDGIIVSNPIYGTYQALYPPVYPLLLAAVKALGLGAASLGFLIDAAAAFILYRLTKCGRAASAYFLFPTVLLSSVLPAKEGLAVLLVLTCMLTSRPLLYGLVTGVLALTQPVWVPLVVIAFSIRFGLKPKLLAWAALGGILVLSPWWIRNWLLFHRFIPLTSGFWMQMSVAILGEHVHFAKFGSEFQILAATKKLALDALAADPAGYAYRSVRNAVIVLIEQDDLFNAFRVAGYRWATASTLVGQLAWLALLGFAARSPAKPDRMIWGFLVAGTVSIALQTWLEFGTRHIAFVVPLALIWIASGYPLREGVHQPVTDPVGGGVVGS